MYLKYDLNGQIKTIKAWDSNPGHLDHIVAHRRIKPLSQKAS